jgi:hypothetical protein
MCIVYLLNGKSFFVSRFEENSTSVKKSDQTVNGLMMKFEKEPWICKLVVNYGI